MYILTTQEFILYMYMSLSIFMKIAILKALSFETTILIEKLRKITYSVKSGIIQKNLRIKIFILNIRA